MGFINRLNRLVDEGKIDYLKLTAGLENACTYPDFFYYWRENLFERLMRLFIWEGFDDPLPKEIEERLILAGHCGVCDFKGKLTAFFGSFYGVTVYNDEWTNYNVHSPIYSASKTIDDNIIVIDSNSLRNPTFEHVNHYAALLAHAEVTLLQQLVEARDSGGVPVAKTEAAKQSVLTYQAKKYNGKIGVVSDPAGIGIEYLGADRHTQLDIGGIWEVRTKLLKHFYADIGVRATFDKRNNTVVDEITSDTSMLLYNISDMLKCRQRGCEKINDLFGTSASVRLSDEIDYNTENEPEAPKQEGGNGDAVELSRS